MNLLERVLAGEAASPPPIWMMRQAGRYLPEYRALRGQAADLLTAFTTPEMATEITLQPIRRYDVDAAILYSDILILPWALGHGLRFDEGRGPVLPKLDGAAGVDRLDLARARDMTAPVLETVRRVRASLDPAKTLIGFAGAPFTVACYMVEGGGSKEFADTRAMAFGEPALFGRLMDVLTEATIAFLSAQLDAGADVVMLFDSWAGVLSPTLFREHVIKPARRIVQALRAERPGVRVIGFPRLAGTMLAEYATETGVDCVAMDTATDPVQAAASVPARIALQGNLDPLALLAGGAALDREVRSILAAMRGRPHIFNLGHGILQQTPLEHVAALVHLVRHH
jgi:uroporphyrinogen decarboxylase